MMNSIDEIKKRFDQFLWGALGLSCISILLIFMITPSISGSPSVFKFTIIYMSVMLLIGLYFWWQLYLHKNWARRMAIAGFLFYLPSVPLMFSPSAYAGFETHRTLARVLGLIGLVYDFAFTVFLLKPEVRSMFTATPPKRSRQVLYGCIAFGFGLLYMMFGQWSQKYADEHRFQTLPQGNVPIQMPK